MENEICPDLPIIIAKVNCGIFRHGVFIENGKQIDQHLPKKDCVRLVKKNEIYGCGKPFRIELLEDGTYKVSICDYI
jgi:hypothetical protein